MAATGKSSSSFFQSDDGQIIMKSLNWEELISQQTNGDIRKHIAYAIERGGQGVSPESVKDLKTYMTVMSVQKMKTTIEVEVTRDGKKVKLKVDLE